MKATSGFAAYAMIVLSAALTRGGAPAMLPGARPLTWQADDEEIASRLVAGVDRFLLRKLDESVARRPGHWRRDLSSAERYDESIAPNRARLGKILGAADPRAPFDSLMLTADTQQPALVGEGEGWRAYAVRWPVMGDMFGEGLLLTPTQSPPIADIVALPDADQTPEMIAGLVPGAESSQFARRLAESGCRVIVPVLIDREMRARGRRAELTNREFLYRSAFELGRHVIGYEVQKTLALADWFVKQADGGDPRIGLVGWGEGGLLALYAGALDPRIDAICVSGYFDSRQSIWREPIDRNVFGLLEQFGDAELAAMIAPRALVIEASRGPERVFAGRGGAPARLVTPRLEDVRGEWERARRLLAGAAFSWPTELVVSGEGAGPPGTEAALRHLLQALDPRAELAPSGAAPRDLRRRFDPRERQDRQIHEMDRHNQQLLRESPYERKEFLRGLDIIFAGKSAPMTREEYREFIEPYREFFREEVIGSFDDPLAPPNARVRKAYEQEKWTGYEVVLDVFPDVIAYGVLLRPKDIRAGEKRPVVVCQHGLEGRPRDVIEGDHRAYHDFAAKLAERGFITFAPQNLYIFGDRFRTLQRKANPLKKTLFSIMAPQHQQVVNWLSSLPCVDPARIAFYGLSYGGKSAMRIPPLVKEYCLSICSGDFNDWVWKNASTRCRYSYVGTGEYEMFEFGLGGTFNYAEMAALIAPRPFMVERGHFDGVGPDEAVAYEFAKVRLLYDARLAVGDRCEIEWFTGPHMINGRGTFDFLHRHLRWPRR